MLCRNPPHAALESCQAFDRLLCVSSGNAGGSSTKTRDKAKFAVQVACRDAGLTIFTEPISEIPGTTNPDGTTTSLQPDIRDDGLREPESPSSSTSPTPTL